MIGAAHRQEELARLQRQQMMTGTGSATGVPIAGMAPPPGIPTATVASAGSYPQNQPQRPSSSNTGVIYNADGTIAQ